jgi:hypothetical protein
VPSPVGTTSQYVLYEVGCDSASCASVLTVTTSEPSASGSTPPTAPAPATTSTTATAASLSRLARIALKPVPRHRHDLVRLVFVRHLPVAAHAASLATFTLTTSASQSTGLSILGVQFGVVEDETAVFWTHGEYANGNLDESWSDGAPNCQPGQGISIGATATLNSCKWWYSPAVTASGEMSARDNWTASAYFKGFPVSNTLEMEIHVYGDDRVTDTFS